jgi:alpha-mannosidase
MTPQRLHMIGNAHIDPVWLWQWPEGYQEVRATFHSAIDRLEEYPEFVFTMDSSLFLAWVEESDPELFAQIRERVAEGRFQVVGGWWLEPDCNIPGGESFVRQALYGQRYLKEKLGITATTGANLDSFGHNATIPQILAKSGCDSYVFLRPGPREKTLESPVFWWESPDGSRVLAYRIPHEYCAPKDDIGEHLEQAIASLPDADEEYAVFYGVGNTGAGRRSRTSSRSRRSTGAATSLDSSRARCDASSTGSCRTVRATRRSAASCSTTPPGATRRTRA